MHINPIASIRRAVLGPARHEDVPACHGPCLGLIKDLSCQQTGHDVPIVPKNLNPTRHEAREGRAGLARHGPSPSSRCIEQLAILHDTSESQTNQAMMKKD